MRGAGRWPSFSSRRGRATWPGQRVRRAREGRGVGEANRSSRRRSRSGSSAHERARRLTSATSPGVGIGCAVECSARRSVRSSSTRHGTPGPRWRLSRARACGGSPISSDMPTRRSRFGRMRTRSRRTSRTSRSWTSQAPREVRKGPAASPNVAMRRHPLDEPSDHDAQLPDFTGGPSGTRTLDPRVKSPVLCQLS